jgi:hypothetical protein
MHRIISVYGRKIFSMALIFNALLCISCALGILYGFYKSYPLWKPFAPFLLDGNLFWLIVAGGVINIFPAAFIGKVHMGRLWFHHYVYGIAVLLASAVFIALFTEASLLTVFFNYNTNVPVNVGRFFLIGGLALLIDDLPDAHKVTRHSLKWLKSKAFQTQKALHWFQLSLGFVALYFSAAITLFLIENPESVTPANFILIGTILITSIASFMSAKRKIWLNIQKNSQAE